MALKSKVDFGKVKKIVIDGRLANLKLEANNIITGIVNRTQSGKDVANRAFKKYSTSYAKIKAGYSSKVNLTVKGHMLNNITWKELKGGIRLYFSSAAENTKAHGNQVKNGRKFLGVDPQQKKDIAKRLSKL